MLSFQHSAGLNARQPSHTAQPIQLRQGGMRRLAKTTTKKDLSVTFKGKFWEAQLYYRYSQTNSFIIGTAVINTQVLEFIGSDKKCHSKVSM